MLRLCLSVLVCCFLAIPAKGAEVYSTLADVKAEPFECIWDVENLPKQWEYEGVRTGHVVNVIPEVMRMDRTYPLFRDAVLNRAVASFFLSDFETVMRNRIHSYEEVAAGKDVLRDWEVFGRYYLLKSSEDCLTVLFDHYYLSAARGADVYVPLTLSLKDGRRLGLKDMFREPDKALRILQKHCGAALVKELGADAVNMDGLAPKAENYKVLLPLKDGLLVIIPPYQAASGALGEHFVEVPLPVLKAAGPRSPVW